MLTDFKKKGKCHNRWKVLVSKIKYHISEGKRHNS